MITEKFSMDVLAIGTDDGKQTYEIRRKWGEYSGPDVRAVR